MERLAHDGSLIDWFKKHGPTLPKLSALAKIFHSIPPSSVPSESLFSKAGLLYAKHLRNR